MKPIVKTITWLTIFAIAMGFLETSVVVYLRKLYYPGGFAFPLVPVTPDIAITEFWREAATIIMLISAGIMSGKNPLQRFVFFLYTFAIWDLFYYVFLKMLLNWPASFLTPDILFLIPIPWVGPVLAPCLISLSMILLTFVVVYHQEKGKNVRLRFTELFLLITGSVTAIISFVWDYIMYISGPGADKGAWTLSGNQNMFDEIKHYVPAHFNWGLFCAGQTIILIAIFLVYAKARKK